VGEESALLRRVSHLGSEREHLGSTRTRSLSEAKARPEPVEGHPCVSRPPSEPQGAQSVLPVTFQRIRRRVPSPAQQLSLTISRLSARPNSSSAAREGSSSTTRPFLKPSQPTLALAKIAEGMKAIRHRWFVRCGPSCRVLAKGADDLRHMLTAHKQTRQLTPPRLSEC
jgi:hypothetical protein